MDAAKSRSSALDVAIDKLRMVISRIADLEDQKRELEESIRVLRGSSPSAKERNTYAGLGLTASAFKFISQTPGRHRPCHVLKAITLLGFMSDSDCVESQIGIVLKRLAAAGKIRQHAGPNGREYSAKAGPAEG